MRYYYFYLHCTMGIKRRTESVRCRTEKREGKQGFPCGNPRRRAFNLRPSHPRYL